MTVPNDVGEARQELRDLLDRSETWLLSVAAAPETPTEWPEELQRDVDTMRRLRTRAASTLINVALLGAFSSGKSFLLSGLQGGLELVEVPTSDGLTADKFVGLLPSSPLPTTACPASVVPVDDGAPFDASGVGYLRVRFTDADGWENVGNSPPPSRVAAYTMQDSDVTDRLREHRSREVAEVEVLLAKTRLPAKFYDLPGHGSPNPIHEAIVRTAMADADCFIYVSHASRSLADDDLALIHSLYKHYVLTKKRKRVVWVVTAIDSAMHLDHRDVAAWQATVTKNNDYLRENFVLGNGQADLAFIGEGFIPVSPALEARAEKLAGEGADTAARHLAESRMDRLRQAINDLISTETGAKHIAAVAIEARAIITPRQRALTDRLQAERLPIDQLKSLLTSQQEGLTLLETELPRVREKLEQKLENHVQRASRPFSQLAAHFHATLDNEIKAADVRKPAKANRLQVLKTQTLHAWMDTAVGPATVWTEHFERFKADVVHVVGSTLGDSELTGQLPDYTFDVNDLSMRSPTRSRAAGQDLVRRTAALIGLATPVAASGTWLAGMAVGALVPPAGVIATMAAIVYVGFRHHKNKTTSLEVTQEEMISAIDDEVTAIKEQFEMAIGIQGMSVIDRLEDNLAGYRKQLDQAMETARQRIAHPENQSRQDLVDQLKPVCEEGGHLIADLKALQI